MSDLYCPATLVCACPAEDRDQAQALADALRGRRIAAVYSSDTSPAVRTAEIVAASLEVATTACPSLRRAAVGSEVAPESDADVFERHRSQLEEIADLHRGETVLVLGDRTALSLVLPGLASNLTPRWAEDHALGDAETVELDGDADGWLLRRWGSLSLGATEG